LAFGEQFAFLQMADFRGEAGGVRIVGYHHDGFAELFVQAA
jgi:hypothetical protein